MSTYPDYPVDAGDGFEIDLKHYFYLLRSYWWLIALTTLVAGGAAFVVGRLSTPVYSASTTLLIDTRPETGRADLTEIATSERLARTYAEIIESRRIREQVADELGIEADELAGAISAERITETQLLRIRVESTDRQRAAEIANRLADVFAAETLALQTSGFSASKDSLQAQLQYLEEQIANTSADLDVIGEDSVERSRLEGILAQYNENYTNLLQSFEQLRLAEIQSTSNIVQLDTAEIPRAPVRPNVLQNTILGAVIGFMLGIGIVFLIDFLDDTVKSPTEAERLAQVPVISMLGRRQTGKQKEDESELVTISNPRSPFAEAFRDLRTALLFSAIDKPNGIIAVTSANPGEGKTTVTANIGVVLAQAGHRVLIMDCDMRRPRMHQVFDTHYSSGGLTSLLLNLDIDAPTAEIDSAIGSAAQTTEQSNLFLMTTGPLPPNPSELLGSTKMAKLLDLLSDRFEYVIIDTPPSLVVTDAFVLGVRADGMLLVVQAGSTRRNQLADMSARFRDLQVPVLGVAMNKVSARSGSYYYYYYYKQPYYASEEGGKQSRRNGRPPKRGVLDRFRVRRT